ncbi:hypothetical protein [Pengzhenrongella sicca]|uniref:Uncharacterized protein n=1 Tax=Pengzhenrongella sicca TaxID=2819238 RepID=A0A8A4ZI24_9MICO|nr:hypothetical protein [Pengzhenrongella sicca]QTE30915.1 hypothetical protein J4E96_08320 [Pengzhenrongella sicca]
MTEPLSILGVDAAGVGQPRNDGTPGSALYAVPIKLSRAPSFREGQFLVYHWDNPSSWSTMHRKGIARVVGDCLVLNGTTVEEVRDHHVGTLKQVVLASNQSESEAAVAEKLALDAATARRRAHETTVEAVASEIRFD